jgi:hypothetical protein
LLHSGPLTLALNSPKRVEKLFEKSSGVGLLRTLPSMEKCQEKGRR